MDTVICGPTAYRYWRIPPIVHLLCAAPEDYPVLRAIIGLEELRGFRNDLDSRSPFTAACSGKAWRNVREESKTLRESHRFLSSFANYPVDVLVHDRNATCPTGILTPWLWTRDLPYEATTQIVDDLYVTTPAFTLLQLASKASLAQTVMLAGELCGSYAVYDAPPPIANQLNKLAACGRLHNFAGWSPCLSESGQVTNLWKRPPLLTPGQILSLADEASPCRGCRTLRQAAELVVPLAASPFETQAGILLGFSRRRGGEGFGGFTHNERVELSRAAKLIADRGCCYCDLYWPDGLDIECQSAQYHDGSGAYLSDADRSAALELMGVKVLPLTFKQLKDERRFEAFSKAVAHALGTDPQPKTAKELAVAEQLRSEVLVDWNLLPSAAVSKPAKRKSRKSMS